MTAIKQNPITSHEIFFYGTQYLLMRFIQNMAYPSGEFEPKEQAKMAMQVAEIPDEKARKFALELLQKAVRLEKRLADTREALTTIGNALEKIAGELETPT